MRFSHIYIEERALDYPLTGKILSCFEGAEIVKISHYKDIFNRKHQNFSAQEESRKLILAVNDSVRFFKTAPVCQDFDLDRSYYTENAMNCVFDCEYCFLKGMYPGANIVIFVNTEDYDRDVDELLKSGPVHINTSYETDLLALNSFTGLADHWEELALKKRGLTVELRTKSALSRFTVSPDIIYAFSLSPSEVIGRFEHKTASLERRLDSVRSALEAGATVRLCLDPMIYIPDHKKAYGDLLDRLTDTVDLSKVRDISIGTFRISKDYLKQLRKNSPGSSAVLFPFENEDGYCVYPGELREEMTSYVKERLMDHIDGGKIYVF